MPACRELLELVGLDPDQYGRRFPHELSGGERQRVGVARALGGDPPVLLMDEPFGAVDPVTRQRLQQQFLDLQAELKKTIVFVTHDIEEATKLGDRIAVLSKGGVLEQYDTPSEVLGRPATGLRGRLRRRRPGGPTVGRHAPSTPTTSSIRPRSCPINPCSTSGQPSVARTAAGRWWSTTRRTCTAGSTSTRALTGSVEDHLVPFEVQVPVGTSLRAASARCCSTTCVGFRSLTATATSACLRRTGCTQPCAVQ